MGEWIDSECGFWKAQAFQNPRISAFQHACFAGLSALQLARAQKPWLTSRRADWPTSEGRRPERAELLTSRLAKPGDVLKCSNHLVGRLDVDARWPSFWPLLSLS
jgi:hypothetical protein